MPAITLVLHNIRSTYNVGSIFRTAEGFGVEKIILSGYTPYPAYPGDDRLPHIADKITKQIHKTALGAEKMVSFEYCRDIDSKISEFKRESTPLIALEQHAKSISLKNYKVPEKFVLLLGEEVQGIEPQFLDRCDAILEIPMVGQKESFNVSVVAGIALFSLSDIDQKS
jgi:23S rRNA (guanosine2251-2'-O)-methyltransferase